jgi:arginase
MRARFRGITRREGVLIHGPAGWGEFSPFAEYGPKECARWLTAAREACRTLADGVQASLRDGATAAVIGGECTLIAGALAGALSAEPELSLVYFDAHGDFNTLATTPSHFVGGMCLAHVCGRQLGPLLWPGVRAFPESQVYLVGARDLDPGERANLERSKVRRFAFGAAGSEAAALVAALRRKRLFVHLDLDVVDPSEMPAVNFPSPGGVTFDARAATLGEIARGSTIVGLELCAYDPRQDPGRELPGRIATAVAPLLGSRETATA